MTKLRITRNKVCHVSARCRRRRGVGGVVRRRAASGVVGCRRASSGRLVLEQQRRVLEAQVGPERVDAAVGGGAVGAQRALRRVRVEVVPAVGHLLAARLAAPQRRALGRRHEHAVVRVLRRVRALCNATYRRRHASPSYTTRPPIFCNAIRYHDEFVLCCVEKEFSLLLSQLSKIK